MSFLKFKFFQTLHVSLITGTVKVHPVGSWTDGCWLTSSCRLARAAVTRRAAPRRFGSAVAVFESPLDAKQTARLHTRSGLSATDSAVETAVTRPQATTAPTVARGSPGEDQWPTGAGARTGDAVNPLTSLLPRNI